MKQRDLELDTGLRAHLLEWDAARGDRTVILVHGFLDLAWSFRPTAERLAERFHVVAPDMRGHGDSARVGAGGYYHFMDYVADLASLVELVARPRVALVGHSMGGSIVSYTAGAFPGRFERVALLEGLGPPVDDGAIPERVAHWTAAWKRARARSPRGYDSIKEAAERLLSNDPLLDRGLALELAEHGTRLDDDERRRFKHDPLHLTRGPYPFRVDVAESFWRRIPCPVLLVDGTESSFAAMGAEAERRAACFQDARRVEISGAGHMIQRHQPLRLAEVLLDFLGD
ncbi:MAG: alpha/beta hydrolase [Myxococcales bacterium]|nr:alpha/beta hydrolase [Myxococcales bacterium]MCB9580867.1 alpha/beta hydrolase [Polyangiaceae bacterium]